MKFVPVQFVGGLSWSAEWPDPPPELRILKTPPRLRVPIIGHNNVDISNIRIDARVRKGENLVNLESASATLSPASARIAGLTTVTLLDGKRYPAVELEDVSDEFLSEVDPFAPDPQKPHTDNLAHWINTLRQSGVWAHRRGCPDLIAQLLAALSRPIDTILCSLLDADPPLRLNAVLGRQGASLLAAGLKWLGQLTDARRISLIVESGSPARWWTPLERELRKTSIQLLRTEQRYPQSDPTLLAHNFLDRRLRPGHLPMDQGVMILDAQAVIAVGRRVSRHQPLVQTAIGLRDHPTRRSFYLVAPIGMRIADLLQQIGVDSHGVLIRGGDALREVNLTTDAVIAPSELTIHLLTPAIPRNASDRHHGPDSTGLDVLPEPPDPCIRCGWCAESCPTRVQPAGLLEAAQRNDLQLAHKYGLDACVECGVCAYVCPSRLPLLQAIASLKEKKANNP